MNLHLNLILESEKRSGASIRVWFLVRLVLILVPAVLLLYSAYLAYQMITLRKETDHFRELIAARQEQMTLSAQIAKQKKTYEDMLSQIHDWAASRLPVADRLDAFRLTVPLDIQLTSLRLTRTIRYTNSMPVAIYALQIRGKTRGEESELTVDQFLTRLRQTPGLASDLESAQVPPGAFLQDREPGAHPLDRVFLLECLFKPLGRTTP
jgi:Tfp pilus assembly protein PilN